MKRVDLLPHLMVVGTLLLIPSWICAESLGSGINSTASPETRESGQSQSSIQNKAADMTEHQQGATEKYDVVPVRRGELVDDTGHTLDQVVKNKKGETLGTIEKLLKDKKTGRIEYAVLELQETRHHIPLQWTLIQQDKGKLTLNASKDELHPQTNSLYTKDLSPDISHYMSEINKVRSQPKPTSKNQTKRDIDSPAATGPMGESAVGGGGPSGTRPLPPGGAPGYEGGHPSSKR
ncbi:MAG: hypothetical protein Nkreftii_002229 [Candidatus Nitrospira kreftii]|uniref:PRC-barrel domain-containing protein n=1 Tax=Candidatus Nitrospira kreftii TaxID=2652173 RepID=A0A7S8IZX7_9BACT|nr:MAG: hypothetical protein Nkreftii_002229 [Candidatus Nitrospira kreftii]